MQDKVIGIIGGMGPESTADFLLKIVRATPARKDQDHLRIIVDNNPQIPDRTLAILHNGKSPLPELEETLHNLERAGAELIAMPCNTAHYYYQELQSRTSIPIINMVLETAEYISERYPHIKSVGLLATRGTIEAKIYHDVLKSKEMEIVVPSEAIQKLITEAVYGACGIKAGFSLERPISCLIAAAKALVAQGAGIIILGCSEICSVLNQDGLSVPLIDSIQVLAEAVVKNARATNGFFGTD